MNVVRFEDDHLVRSVFELWDFLSALTRYDKFEWNLNITIRLRNYLIIFQR